MTMNKTLIENLKRIHTLTYGKEKSNLIVENYVFYPLEEEDEDKADEVTGEVNDFFKSLEVSKEDGLSVEEIGSMEYKKSVESLQIGLILLGYELPRFGVDGLFGPETEKAVDKFINDNEIEVKDDSTSTATPEMLVILIEKLKSEGISEEDLKKHINSSLNADGSIGEKTNGVEIARYLIKKGYSPSQASGIAGNIYVESGYKTGALGDGGTSYGLCQWHNTRWERLVKFCEEKDLDSSSVEGQLIYLDWELKTREKKARKELMKTTTPYDSAYAFAKYFERPSKINPKRMRKAEEVFQKLN
tara:strand:+ start:1342 stop:2250 length:909 start_codon:yes stop_codon:yes gene_type:complete